MLAHGFHTGALEPILKELADALHQKLKERLWYLSALLCLFFQAKTFLIAVFRPAWLKNRPFGMVYQAIALVYLSSCGKITP